MWVRPTVHKNSPSHKHRQTETRALSETAIVHAIMRQKPNFHDLSLCAHSSDTTLSEQLPSKSAANVLIAASISVLKITSCHHRFVVDALHVREELAASTADWRRSRPARCLHRLSHPVVCAAVCNSFCESSPTTCFNLVGDATSGQWLTSFKYSALKKRDLAVPSSTILYSA